MQVVWIMGQYISPVAPSLWFGVKYFNNKRKGETF